MFSKAKKVIVTALVTLFAAWVLFWIIFNWPAFRTVNEIGNRPDSSVAIQITLNDNMPSYEYKTHNMNTSTSLISSGNQLHLPKNINVQLKFVSEDKLYRFSAEGIGVDIDVVPGLMIEKNIEPPIESMRPIFYTISTNEGTWSFRIKLMESGDFVSFLNEQTQSN